MHWLGVERSDFVTSIGDTNKSVISLSTSELLSFYRVIFFRSQGYESSVISSSKKYGGRSVMFVFSTCDGAPFMKALKSVDGVVMSRLISVSVLDPTK